MPKIPTYDALTVETPLTVQTPALSPEVPAGAGGLADAKAMEAFGSKLADTLTVIQTKRDELEINDAMVKFNTKVNERMYGDGGVMNLSGADFKKGTALGTVAQLEEVINEQKGGLSSPRAQRDFELRAKAALNQQTAVMSRHEAQQLDIGLQSTTAGLLKQKAADATALPLGSPPTLVDERLKSVRDAALAHASAKHLEEPERESFAAEKVSEAALDRIRVMARNGDDRAAQAEFNRLKESGVLLTNDASMESTLALLETSSTLGMATRLADDIINKATKGVELNRMTAPKIVEAGKAALTAAQHIEDPKIREKAVDIVKSYINSAHTMALDEQDSVYSAAVFSVLGTDDQAEARKRAAEWARKFAELGMADKMANLDTLIQNRFEITNQQKMNDPAMHMRMYDLLEDIDKPPGEQLSLAEFSARAATLPSQFQTIVLSYKKQGGNKDGITASFVDAQFHRLTDVPAAANPEARNDLMVYLLERAGKMPGVQLTQPMLEEWVNDWGSRYISVRSWRFDIGEPNLQGTVAEMIRKGEWSSYNAKLETAIRKDLENSVGEDGRPLSRSEIEVLIQDPEFRRGFIALQNARGIKY